MTAYPSQAIQAEADAPKTVLQTSPQVYLWTVDQYLKMIDIGLLTTDDKTELLDGHLIRRMASNKPHDDGISFIQDYFTEKYFGKHTLRSERAIKLSDTSMPEPDYVVAVYREDKYKGIWPTPPDILLLVEVADSSLRDDRTIKQQLYAEAGIKEYWIVNIPNRQIELHLRPDLETKTYASIEHHKQGETFESPLVGEVIVNDIIPGDLVEDE